jgi:hypothetical protein
MKCTQCGGRAQLSLCARCTTQLDQMLDDLSWLLGELETTATRQDRLTTGGSRSADQPSPANLGAVELLRAIREELRWLAAGINLLPMGVAPRLVVWWLRQHFDEIVRRSDAATFYRSVARLVGFSTPGPVHAVINRPDRKFVGDCPECGELCYAHTEDVYTVCPQCGVPIDVQKNRTRTIVEYDLLPERALLQILDNLREHVPRVTLYSWIKSGRLPIAGYLSSDGVVAHKGGPRDPRVYSLSRARALRRREQTPQLALVRS